MLEFYVESEFRRCRLRQCPVGTHLEGLADWLHSAGYKQRPGQLLSYFPQVMKTISGGRREGCGRQV